MNATQKRLHTERHDEARILFGPMWSALAVRLRFEDGVTEGAPTGDITQPAPGTPAPQTATPTAPAAPGDSTNPPLAPAEPQAPAPGPVPYDRFNDVNERMKQAELKTQQYEQYILSQQQGWPQQGPGQQPPQQSNLSKLGMTVDELLTEDGLARYTDGVVQMSQQHTTQVVQALEAKVAQMMNQTQTPDLGQVVGMQNAVTGQFQCGQALQTYMNAHPDQAQQLAYAAQLPAYQKIVYDLVTGSPGYQQQQQQATQATHQANTQQVNTQVAQINTRAVNASELAQAGTLDEAQIRQHWTPEQVRAHADEMRARAG